MAKHADRMAGEGKRRGGGQAPSGPPSSIPDPYNWKHGSGNNDGMSGSDQSDPNCAISLTSNESVRYGMPSMNGHHHGGRGSGGSMSEDMLYSVEGQKNNGNNASVSAFTPIQAIPGLPGTGNSPSAGHRAYFPYGDSFNFTSPGKTSSIGPMDMKMASSSDGSNKSGMNSSSLGNGGGPSAFPNQLIALHQIRNYAAMPPGAGSGNHGSTSPVDQQQSNNNNSSNNNNKEKN